MDFFDSQLIIEHLKNPAFGFEKVEGAAEYATVEKIGSFRPNTLYVVIQSERSKSIDKPAAIKRAIAEITFGVVCVGRNYRDRTGNAALKDIGPVIGRARKAIMAWQPKGCSDACRWLEGRVLDYDQTNFLWADVFTTSYVIGN